MEKRANSSAFDAEGADGFVSRTFAQRALIKRARGIVAGIVQAQTAAAAQRQARFLAEWKTPGEVAQNAVGGERLSGGERGFELALGFVPCARCSGGIVHFCRGGEALQAVARVVAFIVERRVTIEHVLVKRPGEFRLAAFS